MATLKTKIASYAARSYQALSRKSSSRSTIRSETSPNDGSTRIAVSEFGESHKAVVDGESNDKFNSEERTDEMLMIQDHLSSHVGPEGYGENVRVVEEERRAGDAAEQETGAERDQRREKRRMSESKGNTEEKAVARSPSIEVHAREEKTRTYSPQGSRSSTQRSSGGSEDSSSCCVRVEIREPRFSHGHRGANPGVSFPNSALGPSMTFLNSEFPCVIPTPRIEIRAPCNFRIRAVAPRPRGGHQRGQIKFSNIRFRGPSSRGG